MLQNLQLSTQETNKTVSIILSLYTSTSKYLLHILCTTKTNILYIIRVH